MEFLSILSVIAAALGLVTAVLQFAFSVGAHAEARRALTAAREPKVDRALREGDLRGLGEYFFNTLGRLPLSGYAEDAEARRVVSDAVRNVETFLRADHLSIAGDPEVLRRRDAERAESDIAAGDLWGGLSRLRRQIELSLRAVAADAGIAVGRRGPNQLLRHLVAAGAVSPGAANSLRRAVDICNRAVHGDPVSGEEAEEALALAADGLAGLDLG